MIVIDFDSGNPYDSYTEVAPTGTSIRKLAIHGYLRAGFDRTLTRAAVVEGGLTNGSAADQSSLLVGSLGSSHRKSLWRFVDDVNFPLSWSPSATNLAVGLAASTDRGGNVYSDPPAGLWVVSTGGSAHRLAEGDVGPVAWGPDGRTIAFMPMTLSELEVVPAEGGSARTVAQFPSGIGIVTYGNPTLSWSPDGSEIAVAYDVSRNSGPARVSQVAVFPVNGGTPRDVLGPSSDVTYTGASFSPDGKELAVTVVHRDAPPPANGPTSPTTSASNVPQPAGVASLDLVHVDGTDLRQIYSFAAVPVLIGWYPDA